MTSNKCNR